MLLRSTMATGMQQATAKAATNPPTSRTASIGRAKKNRSNPSAIVMTAKHSRAPRPRTASACASNLVARSIRAIAVNVQPSPPRAAQSCTEKAGMTQGRAGATLLGSANEKDRLAFGWRAARRTPALALLSRPAPWPARCRARPSVPCAGRSPPPILREPASTASALRRAAAWDGKTTLFFGLLFSFSRLAAL